VADPIRIDFDNLLAEAQRPPVTFHLPDGNDDPIVVHFPDRERAELIDKARMSGGLGNSDANLIAVLFGDDQGKRINAFLDHSPADLGGRLVERVFREFRLPDAPGN